MKFYCILLYKIHRLNFATKTMRLLVVYLYRRSSRYDGLDLRCFKVMNAPHKNIKDNYIDAVKLDYCDQELQ